MCHLNVFNFIDYIYYNAALKCTQPDTLLIYKMLLIGRVVHEHTAQNVAIFLCADDDAEE